MKRELEPISIAIARAFASERVKVAVMALGLAERKVDVERLHGVHRVGALARIGFRSDGAVSSNERVFDSRGWLPVDCALLVKPDPKLR